MVALICSYKALVLGVRLSQARYSSDVNTLGEDGILPVAIYRHSQSMVSKLCSQLSSSLFKLTSVTPDGRQFRR